MNIEFIRKVNLVEQLSDAHPNIGELAEEDIAAWDEDQIRAHYSEVLTSTVSARREEDQAHSTQPGGGNPNAQSIWAQLQTPASVRSNQLAATVQGYREQAMRDGIPFREHGLFPPEDKLLLQLASEAGTHAFEKHLAGKISPYEVLKNGSWTSGDKAAQEPAERKAGVATAAKESHGTVIGAARLGERASIGNGYFMAAHGGAIESLLDEATAELGKMEFSPMLSTIEADFKIRKSVPLNTTMKIECEIKEVKGMRCWVNGYIKDSSGIVLATCVAQLVDLQQLWAAQGQ